MTVRCWCDRCGNELTGEQMPVFRNEDQLITDGQFIVRVDTRGRIDRNKPTPHLCFPCQIDIVRNGSPYVEKEAP
jgi:hypothetical protein